MLSKFYFIFLQQLIVMTIILSNQMMLVFALLTTANLAYNQLVTWESNKICEFLWFYGKFANGTYIVLYCRINVYTTVF